jgi:thiol-disulfide isomerase/thioredoxin
MTDSKFLTLESIGQLEEFKQTQGAVLVYFSHEKCNVCKVLKPKIAATCRELFPEIKLTYADTVNTPEISAQFSIFTVPTVLVFLDGREFLRESRNISIPGFIDKLQRPYDMLFSA